MYCERDSYNIQSVRSRGKAHADFHAQVSMCLADLRVAQGH